MAKIPKWLINTKDLRKDEMDKFCCRNGSFTCGLLTKLYPLDLTRRCNSCIKENLNTRNQNKKNEVKK